MKLKVWTVIGTRPEIIRLAPTIGLFDEIFNHTLIHTGQNTGTTMSDVFFDDLDVREPDYHLGVQGDSLGELIGDIFNKFGVLLNQSRPDAVVVLGDTNSGLVTILARREGIATYHLEAGNRSFDSRVPEETNRRIIDHSADFNLAYNSYSYQNLLREGIAPDRVFITGSPMLEVLSSVEEKVANSRVLEQLGLSPGNYLVGSFHRQENVDAKDTLESVVRLANGLCENLQLPMVLPLHPRTKDRASKYNLRFGEAVRVVQPLGIVDYLALQKSSYATISDSGTLAEESAILGFVGVSARESTERPEAHHSGALSLVSTSVSNCIEAIRLQKSTPMNNLPEGYDEALFSVRVANIVISTARRRDYLIR